MIKFFSLITALLIGFSAVAAEIDASALKLTPEQNQKLAEMKDKLKAEVEPIAEEVESGRRRITEIEKKYFEEFWNMLSAEQKEEFMKLNK